MERPFVRLSRRCELDELCIDEHAANAANSEQRSKHRNSTAAEQRKGKQKKKKNECSVDKRCIYDALRTKPPKPPSHFFSPS